MAVVAPPAFSEGSAAGTSRPAAVARLLATMGGEGMLARIGWTILSIGLFVSLWEVCWLVGWADPKLLPPPHIFIGSIADQGKFFNTATRWQVGKSMTDGPSAFESVMVTIGATTMRVFVGLLIATILGIGVGVLVRYYKLFDRLVLPTVTLLSPVSPIAWLPVAIFIFGIGNGPAIFMVVVALFFHMVLATVTQIDGVSNNLINVARTMGASKPQIYWRVIVPAILPGMLAVLRMNLFAAWMVVLIAEAVGVGSGLGQIVMMARNTFNASLVFFTMTLIGLLGFAFDRGLLWVQQRVLWWVGPSAVGGK